MILLLILLQLSLPSGDNAWVVEITSTGGFTGNGGGDIAVSSAGQLRCNTPGMKCPKDFDGSSLVPLVDAVPFGRQTVSVPPWGAICNDCIDRTVFIRRCNAAGMVQVYSASWNDLTASKIPRGVLRLYDYVLRLLSELACASLFSAQRQQECRFAARGEAMKILLAHDGSACADVSLEKTHCALPA